MTIEDEYIELDAFRARGGDFFGLSAEAPQPMLGPAREDGAPSAGSNWSRAARSDARGVVFKLLRAGCA